VQKLGFLVCFWGGQPTRVASPPVRYVIAYSFTNIDIYLKAIGFSLHAYSNTLFVDAKNYKSTSIYFFKFASSTIYYYYSKQKLVTTLTTKAKYISLTYATKEAN
jgi:hypothetical protein